MLVACVKALWKSFQTKYKMEMVGNERNQTFYQLVSSSFEIDTNLTESEMFSDIWVDPFDSVWLKLVTILGGVSLFIVQ